MKALVCEMCNSGDLIKQDGVFVCQHCGCKYSVEEAKKMMVEGTVEVAGTVKIDNSSYVEKYLANARRAMEKEDWAETEKYYNMVEQNDPTNIEAIFYSAYGKAKQSLVDSDLHKRRDAFKVLNNCVSLIDENYKISAENEQIPVIDRISNDIINMVSGNYVYNQRKNGYGLEVWSDRYDTLTIFNVLNIEFVVALDNILATYPTEKKNSVCHFLELMLIHTEYVLRNGSLVNPAPVEKNIALIHKKWNEIDESHLIPEKVGKK